MPPVSHTPEGYTNRSTQETRGVHEARGIDYYRDAQARIAASSIVQLHLGVTVVGVEAVLGADHPREARIRVHTTAGVIAALLALTTPPLVFFIVCFCLLHSARHLREGFRDERGTLPRRTTIAIVVAATAGPLLVALGALAATTGPGALDERLLQLVFIGLAALTVPHMIVVALGDRALARNDETAPIRERSRRLSRARGGT
jgi:Brp/Blh family beta-carotene 15,15'-monooxygenase